MRFPWGVSELELDVPQERLIPLRRARPPAPLADVAAAVRRALEEPVGFPPLRRALTPDDQIAIAVDENIPRPARLLVPILEHLTRANIAPDAVTLLCQPPSTGQAWIDELPEEFEGVRVEMHDPGERSHLAYLATTRHGRRIYLNRTAVDADQLVVLSRVTWDPLLGIHAGEGEIFPNLSDSATRADLVKRLSLDVPGAASWPVRQEATEVAWLLGAPFLVQAILGAGDEIERVLGGPVESTPLAEKLWSERWRVEVERAADVVIAGLSGATGTFLDLARAFAAAARVVKPGGKIVLLSTAAPKLGLAADLMRSMDEPSQALKRILKDKPTDTEAGFLWTSAAEQAHLYLLSGLPGDTVEEMFATPLENAGQTERFLAGDAACILLPDAERTLATVRE